MIEINSHIEDMYFDPVTQKYRAKSGFKTNSRSQSSMNNHDNKRVTFKINHKKSKRTRNLIEKKGLHVDFVIK